jgi:hypothetical protein
MTADSLQKQSECPSGHLFQKGRSGNPAAAERAAATGRRSRRRSCWRSCLELLCRKGLQQAGPNCRHLG